MNRTDRLKVYHRIMQIDISNNPDAEPALKQLSAALKKAKLTHTDIKIDISASDGDEDRNSYIILYGYISQKMIEHGTRGWTVKKMH